MTTAPAAAAPPRNPLVPVSRQTIAGFAVAAASILAAWLISREDPDSGAIWILALAFGFTLQRARFCFAAAFRDLFLFGSGANMKGILAGMAVSTLGFAAIMHWLVSRPASGALPGEAHILPVGLSVIVGGVLFGLGMVIAGGCVSGTLYRMAEGYVASWVTMGGIILGLAGLSLTWNWWWEAIISKEPKIWLPATGGLGYTGAVALTLVAIAAIYVLITWWEARSSVYSPPINRKSSGIPGFTQRLAGTLTSVFKSGWSVVWGGVALGIIAIVMFTVHMPLGVTGELMYFSHQLLNGIGLGPVVMNGLDGLGGCTAEPGGGLINHTFALTVGVLPGALIGALFAGEFRIRYPRQLRRYVQGIGGGVLMGYSAGLAVGCTIGAFFSAIPSLSVSGWLFGLALAGGAFAGTKVIRRIG
jgi:uncharacterized membrane protein YedE/YeeE